MKVNLARLNHVLIPATRDDRDRLRRKAFVRPFVLLDFIYSTLSREGRTLAALSLAAGVIGLDVQSTDAYLLWSAVVGLLTISLFAARAYPLEGVRAEVSAPERVSIGASVCFTIVLRNSSPRAYGTVRIEGPFLPWDGTYRHPADAIPGIAAHGEARAEITARFVQRGAHHLDRFRASALVPLGLTQGPMLYTNSPRFIVVPRIANVVRVTTPTVSRHQPGGVAMASKTGESMDILGVRHYRPGDPVRDLHPRSWARTGIPVVREYQQEYFSRVGVILDTESPDDPDPFEAAISLAAGVVSALTHGEALIDLLVVGNAVHDLTLGRSCGFLDQALDLLACVQPATLADPREITARLASFLPRLSCVIFVACAWDTRRAALAELLRTAGPTVTTLLVTDSVIASPDTNVRTVDRGAITRGERLAL